MCSESDDYWDSIMEIQGSNEDDDYNSVMLIPRTDNSDSDENSDMLVPGSNNDITTGDLRMEVQEKHDIYQPCNNGSSCKCLPISLIINNIMNESKVIQALYFIMMHLMNFDISVECTIVNNYVHELINASIWHPILFRDSISALFVTRIYSLLVEGGVDSVSTGITMHSLLRLLFSLDNSWFLYLSRKADFLQMLLVVIRNRRSEWEKAIYLLLFLSNDNPQNAAKIVRLDPNLWQIGLMRYQDPTDGMKVPLFAKVVMKIYLMAIEISRMDKNEVLRDNLSSLSKDHVRQLIGCQDLSDTLNLEGLGMVLMKAKDSM